MCLRRQSYSSFGALCSPGENERENTLGLPSTTLSGPNTPSRRVFDAPIAQPRHKTQHNRLSFLPTTNTKRFQAERATVRVCPSAGEPSAVGTIGLLSREAERVTCLYNVVFTIKQQCFRVFSSSSLSYAIVQPYDR